MSQPARRASTACRSSLREEKSAQKAWFLIGFITGIFRIGKQEETALPGRRKATFAAFSAFRPCGLANLPLKSTNG